MTSENSLVSATMRTMTGVGMEGAVSSSAFVTVRINGEAYWRGRMQAAEDGMCRVDFPPVDLLSSDVVDIVLGDGLFETTDDRWVAGAPKDDFSFHLAKAAF